MANVSGQSQPHEALPGRVRADTVAIYERSTPNQPPGELPLLSYVAAVALTPQMENGANDVTAANAQPTVH